MERVPSSHMEGALRPGSTWRRAQCQLALNWYCESEVAHRQVSPWLAIGAETPLEGRARPERGVWFVRCASGVAAVEFAVIASVLCVLILNIVDVGRYAYERMQLDSAAHY